MPHPAQASGSSGSHKQNTPAKGPAKASTAKIPTTTGGSSGTSQPGKVTNVGTKLLTERDSITATAAANKIADNYKLKTSQQKASADGASKTKAKKAAK